MISDSFKDIDTIKIALLLMHWQNDIASEGGKSARDIPQRLKLANIIDKTYQILRASRERGILIIYINAAHRPGYPEIPPKSGHLANFLKSHGCLIKDTWGVEVIDQLKPVNDEIVIYNASSCAFCHTDLDIILRNKSITDIGLTGLVTNWIVESTARHAANLGYGIFTIEDCCLGVTDEMHKWSIQNILSQIGIVIESQEYIEFLNKK